MLFHAKNQSNAPSRKNDAAMEVQCRALQLPLQRPQAQKEIGAVPGYIACQAHRGVAGIHRERGPVGEGLLTQPQRAHPGQQPAIENFQPLRWEIAAGEAFKQESAHIKRFDGRFDTSAVHHHIENGGVDTGSHCGDIEFVQPAANRGIGPEAGNLSPLARVTGQHKR